MAISLGRLTQHFQLPTQFVADRRGVASKQLKWFSRVCCASANRSTRPGTTTMNRLQGSQAIN